jgi:hypothetical protein
VSKDYVAAFRSLRLADGYLRRAVEELAKMARDLPGAVEECGEARFRERLGAEPFEEMMALARRYRELGEERFKEVIFAEKRAGLAGEPDRN